MNTNEVLILRHKTRFANIAFFIAALSLVATIPFYMYLGEDSLLFKISIWVSIVTELVYTLYFFRAWILKWKIILKE